ncbi:hypothetical protein BN946_scf185016.g19 [Trametes cinnabarina]|uniref:N-glycosylation protein EOS1 n=1 Tax=Pycnoporus cinnabarinus TaxID=5643 RepID=A0A060SH96_PYCCI|nr:hypothetical protein BN946_scf185016.g19 [Trametes cinnabarina]
MSLDDIEVEFHQDPPPYGPPTGVLLIPASIEVVVAGPPHHHTHSFLRPASSTTTTAATSTGATATSPASRPRSRTIAALTSPPRRRRHSAARAPGHANALIAMSAPSSSPPPYSLTPPEVQLIGPSKRAASSPHLRGPNAFPGAGLAMTSSSGSSHSRQVFSEHARRPARVNPVSDEESESGAETDDGVLFGSRRRGLADTLRHRLLGGKGKGRATAYDDGWVKPITTAPGALCAGETETEGEDSVSVTLSSLAPVEFTSRRQPRNLPTARIRPSSLSQQLSLPASAAWIVQFLFQLFRLLAIVPAVFGTLWNFYHVVVPPNGNDAWRVTTLSLTTGLLKRWKVYYSPFATLIRLLALQAICWPATHLTLSIMDHEARPLVCWAAIGTTTCCSRSVQLWVTSNIVPVPLPPTHHSAHAASAAHLHQPAVPSTLRLGEEELMRKGKRRRWDWAQVGVKCALPAGVVYCVMAWALVLRREVYGC